MRPSRISIIVAWAEHRVIGNNGGMPWHLPADLQHFRRITMGKPILMGRHTCESLGRPLPGRRNLVLSRTPGYQAEGFECLPDLQQALHATSAAPELMIIGGAEVYEQCLHLATGIYLTEVHHHCPGEVVFPALDYSQWQETARTERPADPKNPWPLSFLQLTRKTAPAA